MNQYKIFQKSIHYQVILRMINMRLCLLQKICCRMCAIAAFKRSFLKIIISCLPIHFPSSSKKIFRFTFLLGFSRAVQLPRGLSFVLCLYETNETCDRIMVSNQFCQKKYLQQMLFLYLVFLHWYIYLKDNYISL